MIECYPGQYEMTIITMRGELEEAGLYTSDPVLAAELDAICEEHPEAAQVVQIKRTIPRGRKNPAIESKRYRLHKGILRFDGEAGKPLFDRPATPQEINPAPEDEPDAQTDAEEPHEEENESPFDGWEETA